MEKNEKDEVSGFEWTCANVSDHGERKKLAQKEKGNCPECGRPLFKTKKCFFVKTNYWKEVRKMVDVLEKYQGDKDRSLVAAEQKQIKVKVAENSKDKSIKEPALTKVQMVTY